MTSKRNNSSNINNNQDENTRLCQPYSNSGYRVAGATLGEERYSELEVIENISVDIET
jgi:hypothetical protein